MNKFETLAKVLLGTTLALSFTEGCAPLAKAPETPTSSPTPTLTIEPTETPMPSETPTPTQTPTITPTIPWEILAGTPQAQLEATVDALKTAGLQNSFVPEGAFTKELYEQVAKATFPIYVTLSITSGTSFIVGKEGNTIYLVTNRHVIEKGVFVDNSSFRPTIAILVNVASSPDWVTLEDMQFVVSETRDIALVRGNVPDPHASSIAPLAYQDNYILEAEQRVLAVGWPFEFWGYTSAGYLSVASQSADANGRWWARGLIDSGSSGSPIIVPDTNGNPVVIGVASASLDSVTHPDGTLTVDRWTFFYPLEIDNLKKELESK